MTAAPMAVHLISITGTCLFCEHKVSQISATQEHAEQVVTEAMERHCQEAHPKQWEMASLSPVEGESE